MSDRKAKMAPLQDAPPGLEQDEHGDPIPFGERTSEDQEKARGAVSPAMHSGQAKVAETARLEREQGGQSDVSSSGDPTLTSTGSA